MRNLFCNSEDLHNERDVEALFIEPLIRHLGFPSNRIRRQAAIESLPIPRGSGVEDYTPDYVLLDATGQPVVVIDAKHPNRDPSDYRYQVSGYALLINQRFEPGFPILGVFRLKGQSKRDGSIIVRSCKASQSPVYPIRDAFLAVNHVSCPSLSSSGPRQWGESALKTSRLPGALSLLAKSWLCPPSAWRRR